MSPTPTPTASPDRMRFVTHKGRRILIGDYSALPPAQVVEQSRIASEVIAREPLGSVHYLFDVTGMQFDRAVTRTFRESGERNKPYFAATCIVGLTAIQSAAYKMLAYAIRIDMPAFATRDEGLDYLASR